MFLLFWVLIFQSFKPVVMVVDPFSKRSLSASAALLSRLFAMAIFSWIFVSIILRNISSGNMMMSSLSLSSSGERSGCQDNASDWTILFPGEDCTLPHVFRRILPDSSGFQRTLPECVGVTRAKLACLVWEESGGVHRNMVNSSGVHGIPSYYSTEQTPLESSGIYWIPPDSSRFQQTPPDSNRLFVASLFNY